MLTVSALVLTLPAVGCSGAATRSAGNTRVIGGTAVKAEGPLGTPNYIFPYATALSEPNIADLQYLLYRPLYWFGENGQPTVNNSLSVANPPVFQGAKVTITLKHYMWSNGTPATAQGLVLREVAGGVWHCDHEHAFKILSAFSQGNHRRIAGFTEERATSRDGSFW
ncbi:MAG: hypothetical protein ABR922_25710 [Streptosporangiaceae bacterium]|jgi:peptide/nickel transport system substrate-binding protein